VGAPPWDGVDLLEVAFNVRDKGLHPSIPEDAPEMLKSVMKLCFQQSTQNKG